MNRLNMKINVYAVLLMAVVFVSGCKKFENQNTPENEASLIKSWLEAMVKSNKDIDTTSTGLYYITNKIGTGFTVQAGDTVTVAYTGMFLNGTVFDSSASYTYVQKATGQRMIEGWEEGIEVLNKGGSAVFLLPSAKAYGPYGYSSIPPYSPLLFMIEIIEIK